MKEELKTLKDLMLKANDYINLKAEAVKWVKERNSDVTNIWIFGEMRMSDWFDFFNLTEEDINEQLA